MQRRRSRFAVPAETWLRTHAPNKELRLTDLWKGLVQTYPEICTPTEKCKTPDQSCKRDLRKDPAFIVGGRKVRLADLPIAS